VLVATTQRHELLEEGAHGEANAGVILSWRSCSGLSLFVENSCLCGG
jgi:hypothetical protein